MPDRSANGPTKQTKSYPTVDNWVFEQLAESIIFTASDIASISEATEGVVESVVDWK